MSIYSLTESHNPKSGHLETELLYERSSPPQRIQFLASDWHDLVIEQLIVWSQACPEGLAGHAKFRDLSDQIQKLRGGGDS